MLVLMAALIGPADRLADYREAGYALVSYDLDYDTTRDDLVRALRRIGFRVAPAYPGITYERVEVRWPAGASDEKLGRMLNRARRVDVVVGVLPGYRP